MVVAMCFNSKCDMMASPFVVLYLHLVHSQVVSALSLLWCGNFLRASFPTHECVMLFLLYACRVRPCFLVGIPALFLIVFPFLSAQFQFFWHFRASGDELRDFGLFCFAPDRPVCLLLSASGISSIVTGWVDSAVSIVSVAWVAA